MKKIVVAFSDGKKFGIPAHYIALDKSNYYAAFDNGEYSEKNREDWNETQVKEYNYCIQDDSELLDWAIGNMDWDYLSEFAEPIETEPQQKPDYSAEWVNAEYEVIEDKGVAG